MFYAYQKKLVCTLEKTGVHTRFFWCAYFVKLLPYLRENNSIRSFPPLISSL